MPYNIRQQGSRYAVVDDDGKVVGRHSTRAAAERQRRALYANVPDASKVEGDKNNWDGFFPRRG